MKEGNGAGSGKKNPQVKKREELKMTAKIVDHADAIKYNEKDDGRTYGRNKPVSLSLIV